MSRFKKGDKVIISKGINLIQGTINSVNKTPFSSPNYDILDYDGNLHFCINEWQMTLIKEPKEENKMSSEEKELKKDIEILLNIYLSNRSMNRKEIKRFSERHFDIIEKQNAKNTLKRRDK